MSVWIKVGGAMSRRAAWWLLLACTAFGLASMHTLGHGSLSSVLHAVGGAGHSTAEAAGPLDGGALRDPADRAVDSHGGVASVGSADRVGESCDGHGCPGSGDGHDGAAWNVCLAVLAGLTALLLPGWLLLLLLRGRDGAGAGLRGTGGSRGAARASSRARGVGLRLASVSVLRI
jgi:hypothetical protein